MIGMTLCSGIGAPEVAAPWVDWRLASEIEPFPRAVLQQRFGYRLPDDHNQGEPLLWGDMTEYEDWPDAKPNIVVAGTPCQDLSIGHSAGTGRPGKGLDGARSGLATSFVGFLSRYRPDFFLWENVSNVLSARHGPGFVRFAKSIADLGYNLAWRVLDGRWFGFRDQPRPRLYLVGSYRDSRAAAAILLEPQSKGWDRKAKQEAAPVLTARGGMAFDDRTPCILEPGGARIATPLEWERAMGFPDHHTAITYRGKPTKDGPRYTALGNSMAVPVIRWIMDRMRISMERTT